MNAIDQTGGDGTQRLFAGVSLVDHQTPVHLGKVGVDLTCNVGRQVQRAFEAIVTALGDALSRTCLAS